MPESSTCITYTLGPSDVMHSSRILVRLMYSLPRTSSAFRRSRPIPGRKPRPPSYIPQQATPSRLRRSAAPRISIAALAHNCDRRPFRCSCGAAWLGISSVWRVNSKYISDHHLRRAHLVTSPPAASRSSRPARPSFVVVVSAAAGIGLGALV
ncbi:hypothetical protein BD311DRAFT_771364 [Dichomitus squalens]|uniref:Uncharacterized protein n=1 Tax=Dichomitus squalens TaxID=114155 RepID=A0A4Q9M4Z3_9APHY|nr:hypothetical protein BD311DRAFT_771364 [Dichomitus squalens]